MEAHVVAVLTVVGIVAILIVLAVVGGGKGHRFSGFIDDDCDCDDNYVFGDYCYDDDNSGGYDED